MLRAGAGPEWFDAIVAGSIRAARGTMDNAMWYAVLWGPTWLLGGALFLMTAWTFDAERRRTG